MRQNDKAVVRRRIAEIEGVSATWFEWDSEGEDLLKTLVVEVDFDTDPNSGEHRPYVLDTIRNMIGQVLEQETSMTVSNLRIVPKTRG